jgi:UDP-galactopyranose mutase
MRDALGPRTFFAGRLANYRYLDRDDVMRQALDAGDEVLAVVGRHGARRAA